MQHPICIIGAGPGGVQAAFYYQQLGMPYVLLEAGPKVSSFFREFPRHRGLISINKRHTGTDDAEFNLRHDWNSLLSHFDVDPGQTPAPVATTPGHKFTEYTQEYYPSADVLVQYLEDFVAKYNIKVQCGRTVSKIMRNPDGTLRVVHRATVPGAEEEAEVRIDCTAVVWATGKNKGSRLCPSQQGHELVTYYDKMSTKGSDYDNHEVLVVGSGNASLEVVRGLTNHAAHIHIYMRRSFQMAHQTHYVGHARGLNLAILDHYQLKSQDLILADMPDATKLAFRKDEATGRIHVELADTSNDCGEGRWENETEEEKAAREKQWQLQREESWPLRRGYHDVIVCIGMENDRNPFECELEEGCTAVKPDVHCARKMPVIASNFESVNERDVYSGGSLLHFRDFKKSSGGFIHGFRYTTRTMVLMQRERYCGVPFPSTVLAAAGADFDAVKAALEAYIFPRLGSTSAMYQMPAHLCDVLVFGGDAAARVLRDVPMDVCKSRNPSAVSPKALLGSDRFMTLSLEYGPFFQGLGTVHHQGQAEIGTRAGEKVGWTPENDPDVLLGTGKHFVPAPRSSKPDVMKPPHEEPRPATAREAGEVDTPETEAAQTSGRWREQFLHPVLRVWKRPSAGAPAEHVLTFRMREEVLNEWSRPMQHRDALATFLGEHLRLVL